MTQLINMSPISVKKVITKMVRESDATVENCLRNRGGTSAVNAPLLGVLIRQMLIRELGDGVIGECLQMSHMEGLTVIDLYDGDLATWAGPSCRFTAASADAAMACGFQRVGRDGGGARGTINMRRLRVGIAEGFGVEQVSLPVDDAGKLIRYICGRGHFSDKYILSRATLHQKAAA